MIPQAPKIKLYPKTFEDAVFNPSFPNFDKNIGSCWGDGDVNKLANKFRELFSEHETYAFHTFVRYVWLEMQFKVKASRRLKRRNNGWVRDGYYSYFLKTRAGYSQKPISVSPAYRGMITYLKDFFPDFLEHDPYLAPEKFKFPFKHLTFDHCLFVCFMGEERLALLNEAEEKAMSFITFANWAINWALSENEATGVEKFTVEPGYRAWPYIGVAPKFKRRQREWLDSKMKFKAPVQKII